MSERRGEGGEDLWFLEENDKEDVRNTTFADIAGGGLTGSFNVRLVGAL